MTRLSEELVGRLRRLAASQGLELLAVEVGGTPRRPRLCLVLDRREGGVTLDDCESVSRQASLLLDEADPFPGPYTLEVSSPGLERKFYALEDYERFAGRAVRVRRPPSAGRGRSVEGFLVGLQDGLVHLRTVAGDEVAIPLEEVVETRLHPFLEERLAARSGRSGGGGGDRRAKRV